MATAAMIAEARKQRGEVVVGRRKTGDRRRTEANIQEDISIYKERMSGRTYDELAVKYGMHISSVELAVKRGEKLAKERGVDVEYVKIRINDLFNETLGALAQDVQNQARNGQVIEEYDGQGNLIGRRVARGISARTAGELTRSLARWADFIGVGSGNPEGGSVTMVQLNLPADGASFEGKWQDLDEAAAMNTAAARVEAEATPKVVDVEVVEGPAALSPAVEASPEPQPKRRGRPPGSKNKPKVDPLADHPANQGLKRRGRPQKAKSKPRSSRQNRRGQPLDELLKEVREDRPAVRFLDPPVRN